MDKITRVLSLYSSLMRGDEVSKPIFCLENNCSSRAFDRDIEDVRLFLSESFSSIELIYNRVKKVYSLNQEVKVPLEAMEYLLMEKLLQDTRILRMDEFEELRNHLLLNTNVSQKKNYSLDSNLSEYISPCHNKALLKLYSDLEIAIRNNMYIKVFYQGNTESEDGLEVIPCKIIYKSHHLYFEGYSKKDKRVMSIQLELIRSFDIIRELTIKEKEELKKSSICTKSLKEA